MLFTKLFWKRTLERAVATAAQAPLALVVVAQTGLAEVSAWAADWKTIGGMAAMGGFLSVCKSVAASYVGDPQDPSFVE